MEKKSFLCGKIEKWNEFEDCLHVHFKKVAEKNPKKIAVVDGKRSLTYQELDRRTDILSIFLQKKFHVKLDDSIGIYMDKNIEFVISYIAILKAGCAYSPVEIAYPKNLLEKLFKKANLKVVLTVKMFEKNLPGYVNRFCFENWKTEINEEDCLIIENPNSPNPYNLAYTVFSSGSTGVPKAISCPHIGSIASYFWRIKNFPYEKDEKEACNIFFTWELFRPLLGGQTLYIIPTTVIYDPVRLCDFIYENKITRILFTPSTLQAIFDLHSGKKVVVLEEKLKSLKYVIMCGEIVQKVLFQDFKKVFPKTKMINLYSVSECHDVTCSDVDLVEIHDNFCSTGKIMDNVFIYILDENLEIVEKGKVGEIYVGGVTLARCYLNQEELTKKRFIPNKFSFPEIPEWIKDKRLYKSGDHGIILPDDSLVLIGRCNSMVKIRGYSVELKAVESHLNRFQKISSSVAIKDSLERLVAYVVLKNQNCTSNEIINYLKTEVPHYMIPNHFMRIEKIPISPIGKLDVNELPSIEKYPEFLIPLTDKIILPKTKVEIQIYEIWKEIFPNEVFGIEENFIDLGGNSIKMAKLYGSLKESFKKNEISLPILYDNQSIKKQAKLITGFKKETINWNELCEMKIEKIEKKEFSSFGLNNKQVFLLTGATGYLGSWILKYLLKYFVNSIVICIVRKENPKVRLVKNMKYYDLYDEKEFKRVEIIKGDFSRTQLGVSNEIYLGICEKVDFVIHCGAEVNFLKSYKQLEKSNVIGTKNIIKFCIEKKLKPVIYISSSGVYHRNMNYNLEERIASNPEELDTGYCQSKWVAEKIIENLISNYNFPSLIVRPGEIFADSKTGEINPSHDIIKFICGIIELKKAPKDYRSLDLTPIDYISERIIKLICNTDFTSKLKKFQFNLIHPELIRVIDIIMILKNELKYKIKLMEPSKWILELKKEKENEYYPLYPIFEKLVNQKDCFYESSFKMGDLPRPRVLLLKSVKKLLQKKKVSSTFITNSFTKTVVILGASVGIGKAIAKNIIKSGINVVLGSRREDLLKSIQKEFEEKYSKKFIGKVIYKKCDITKKMEVIELVNYGISVFKKIDILLLNAGIMPATMMKNNLIGEWEKCVNINVNGLLNSIHAVVEYMVKRNEGHIILMSSNAGRSVWETLTVYSASKFFMEAMAQGLRKELSTSNIKITTIQPGDVGFTEIMKDNKDSEGGFELEKLTAKKYLVPNDIARVVLFCIKQEPNCCINEVLIEPIQ